MSWGAGNNSFKYNKPKQPKQPKQTTISFAHATEKEGGKEKGADTNISTLSITNNSTTTTSESLLLYTVGYGGKKTFADFFNLLKSNNVALLVDIRISPLCGFNQDFSGRNLDKLITKNGLKYEHFMELGNIWKDFQGEFEKDQRDSLYLELLDNAGELLTRRLRDKVAKYQGIGGVCIMCACGTHEDCHRGKVSSFLAKNFGFSIKHI